ncbi:NUDIX hydrolase [Flavobacterium sp. K5-23]|uniref:NUDIX hydrolase n=1 Tax=Flavobacterium sp. K5-23 TaxID=2746225 RepID=UPI00200C1B16|nr:NUDIX hydrolase [Flavobacterium sp. K5-23]UQD56915.1 NUDIX hydrolase [Flavobacterium sp. K5-23]
MITTNQFKIFISTVFLLLISLNTFGQVEKEIAVFNRLLILNSENELLVVKIQNTDTWVTPGFYQTKQTIRQGLDSIATTYGLKIEVPELKGIFHLKRDINGELSNSIRNIYTAKTKDRELKMPKGIDNAKWLPINKAVELITFPHINIQIGQIMNNPDKIWGGSLSQFKENGNWKTKILQEFYVLSEKKYNESNSLTKKNEPIKKIDNYTIQWLIVFNQKKEILLMKDKYGWKTPVIRSNENLSLKEGIDSLVNPIGISIHRLRLAGLTTYKYSGLKDNQVVSFRSYYTSKLKDGEISQPKDKEKEYKWLPIEEVLQIIEMQPLKTELNQILKNPKSIWGGSFIMIFEDEKFKTYKQTEPFYELNK